MKSTEKVTNLAERSNMLLFWVFDMLLCFNLIDEVEKKTYEKRIQFLKNAIESQERQIKE